MDNCSDSIFYGTRHQVAAVHVQDCDTDPHRIAGSRGAMLIKDVEVKDVEVIV
jgi:hypothetical protein